MSERESPNYSEAEGAAEVKATEVGEPIKELEASLPDPSTDAAEQVRQSVGELQGQGYTFAEGRKFYTTTGSEAYQTDQKEAGRRVVGYYAGGEMDLFAFNPPEQDQQ